MEVEELDEAGDHSGGSAAGDETEDYRARTVSMSAASSDSKEGESRDQAGSTSQSGHLPIMLMLMFCLISLKRHVNLK